MFTRKKIEYVLNKFRNRVNVDRAIIVALTLALMFMSGISIGQAQVRGPDYLPAPQAEAPKVAFGDSIPIQGRLTNASGVALNGNFDMTFTVYDAATAGTNLCSDGPKSVAVTSGLFNSTVDNCGGGGGTFGLGDVQRFLGIKVGTDSEMTPRQPIYAVPYAQGLMTPLIVSGTSSSAILTVSNSGTGRAAHFSADVSQNRSNNGIPKAGVNANCAGASSSIPRQFNTTTAAGGITASIATGGGTGLCTIDFGFTITDRYFVATALAGTLSDRAVTCKFTTGQTQKLDCFVWDASGTARNELIMVLIY